VNGVKQDVLQATLFDKQCAIQFSLFPNISNYENSCIDPLPRSPFYLDENSGFQHTPGGCKRG
jgi:hypothetical protein